MPTTGCRKTTSCGTNIFYTFVTSMLMKCWRALAQLQIYLCSSLSYRWSCPHYSSCSSKAGTEAETEAGHGKIQWLLDVSAWSIVHYTSLSWIRHWLLKQLYITLLGKFLCEGLIDVNKAVECDEIAPGKSSADYYFYYTWLACWSLLIYYTCTCSSK